MKKKILIITFLTLALCIVAILARPVNAETTCSAETCAEGCQNEETCTADCCPVLIGEKCYPTLESAINAVSEGNTTITLRGDVYLPKTLGIHNKTVTIDGANHTIRPTDQWKNNGEMSGDQSLITATQTNAKVTLKNVTLADSKKYGAQAFNGGELTLENVTVNDCAYGGILANGGTVTVKNLKLGHNGGAGTNNGIEVARQNSTYKEPKIIMDGKIETEQKENVIWLATNDSLEKFQVENTENSEEKIYVNGGQVVVADKEGDILYKSNENSKVTPEATGSSVAHSVYVVDIAYNGIKESVVVTTDGKKLSDVVKNLADIKNAKEGYEFVEFLKDDGTKYDETAVISGNLRLTAVYSLIKEGPTVEELEAQIKELTDKLEQEALKVESEVGKNKNLQTAVENANNLLTDKNATIDQLRNTLDTLTELYSQLIENNNSTETPNENPTETEEPKENDELDDEAITKTGVVGSIAPYITGLISLGGAIVSKRFVK